jgi:hypothetical protein
MFKLNREGIRKALMEYRQAEKEYKEIHSKVMNDKELNGLNERELRKAIRNKYNDYSLLKNKIMLNGCRLIETMKKGIKEYENIQVEKVYYNKDMFDKLLKLAEEV